MRPRAGPDEGSGSPGIAFGAPVSPPGRPARPSSASLSFTEPRQLRAVLLLRRSPRGLSPVPHFLRLTRSRIASSLLWKVIERDSACGSADPAGHRKDRGAAGRSSRREHESCSDQASSSSQKLFRHPPRASPCSTSGKPKPRAQIYISHVSTSQATPLRVLICFFPGCILSTVLSQFSLLLTHFGKNKATFRALWLELEL